jgi:hypothetical protein
LCFPNTQNTKHPRIAYPSMRRIFPRAARAFAIWLTWRVRSGWPGTRIHMSAGAQACIHLLLACAAVGDYGGLNCKYSAALSLIKAGTAARCCCCDRLRSAPPAPALLQESVCVSLSRYFFPTHSCTREYSTRVGNHSPLLATICSRQQRVRI